MTTYLDELFEIADLEEEINAGHVRVQHHPVLPYSIHNYTEKAVYARHWNLVTLQCRGLIVHHYTREVLARPFPKFFNHNEPDAPKFGLTDAVQVTDKIDGSLGILHPTLDGTYAIATRGSFTSDQAKHGTKVYEDKYADQFRPDQTLTLLFEIIYKQNRIVVDYGDTDDLILLGAIDIATGNSFGPKSVVDHCKWPGPRTEEFSYRTFAEALAAPPRRGKEGLVVRRPGWGDQVKLKQDDYVALHRIITGVTARHIWEFLAVNDCWDHARPRVGEPQAKYLERRLKLSQQRIKEIRAVDDEDWKKAYLQGVPAEFRQWVLEQIADLETGMAAVRSQLDLDFLNTVAACKPSLTFDQLRSREHRSEFVRAAQATTENWRMMLSLLDRNEIQTWCWLEVYPKAERPFCSVSEVAA